MFHICPILTNIPDGPIHIKIKGNKDADGTVICEQIKLVDPASRGITIRDSLPYVQIMEISDVLQGIFEYD